MKEQFIQLFEEAKLLIKGFNKQNYEVNFKDQYEKYKEMFEEAETIIECAEDKDAAILEMASVIPDYAKNILNELGSKRKKDNLLIDYNYAMVTYVFPLVNYNRRENCGKLSEKMLELWNKEVTKSPIQNSTYESIYEGFSKRLCYITTAVCESLGKPDDCYELQVLRDYRDTYLLSSAEGKSIVEQYYDIAPTIVNRINMVENAKDIYCGIYEEYLMPCIRLAESKQMEECREIYSGMVRDLQEKYLYS